MKNIIVLLLFINMILLGCSSDSSTAEKSIEFDGTYNMTAISTTEFTKDGGACGDAAGTMIINNSEISGSILDTWGNVYDLSGNILPDGSITDGSATSDVNTASFEGSISGGTWIDIFECAGDWQIIKQ